jgi:prepilin-type N-terminal cleavage/methylation domain-containing protein
MLDHTLGRTMHMSRRDEGFTLVELLITIVLLGVIIVPLGNVIIGFLRNTDAISVRLTESHDAQISAAYLAADVAGVGVRDWADTTSSPPFPLKQSIETSTVTNAGGSYPCVPPTVVGRTPNSNPLVRLIWDDFSGGVTNSPSQRRVAYVLESVAGQTQKELHRIVCAGSSTAISDAVLAHDVVSASASCAGAGGASCVGAGGQVPATVTVSLTVQDPRNTGSPYSIVLTGQRRQT